MLIFQREPKEVHSKRTYISKFPNGLYFNLPGQLSYLMLCARGCSGHSSVSRTTWSRATSLDIDLACIYGAKTDSAPRHDDRRSEMRCAERRLSNCRKRPVSFTNRKPYFFVHGCFIVCAAFCPRFRLYVRAYVVGITMTQHNARVWQTDGRRDNLNISNARWIWYVRLCALLQ